MSHRAALLVQSLFLLIILGILTVQGEKIILASMYLHTHLNLVYLRSVKISLREVRSNHQSELCHSLILDLFLTKKSQIHKNENPVFFILKLKSKHPCFTK